MNVMDSPSFPSLPGSDSEDDNPPPLPTARNMMSNQSFLQKSAGSWPNSSRLPSTSSTIGNQDDKLIFSDGVASISDDVESYSSIFSSIELNIVLTVLMCFPKTYLTDPV